MYSNKIIFFRYSYNFYVYLSVIKLSVVCGCVTAVIGLRMDGKLPYPTYDFDSEEVRYNHRFAAFQCVHTPPPMPYAQFLEMTDVTRYDPPIQVCCAL